MGSRSHDFCHVFQQRTQVEFDGIEFNLPGLDFLKIKRIVDQAHQAVDGCLRATQIAFLCVRELRRAEQFQHTDNAIQRRTNLMTHVAQELTLGATGFFSLVFGSSHVNSTLLHVFKVVCLCLPHCGFGRQCHCQLTHFHTVKRLLENEETICDAQLFDDLSPGVIGVRRANHNFQIWIHFPQVLNRFNPVPARRHTDVDKCHAERLPAAHGFFHHRQCLLPLPRRLKVKLDIGDALPRLRSGFSKQFGLC